MKARTICPACKEEVIDDCEQCIKTGNLVHKCKGKTEPEVFENVKWEIIKGSKEEIEILEKLEFLLSKLVKSPKEGRTKIAYSISDYAGEVLNNKKIKFTYEIEDILVSVLDLDHWKDEKMPSTLSIRDIKDLILEIKKKIRELS